VKGNGNCPSHQPSRGGRPGRATRGQLTLEVPTSIAWCWLPAMTPPLIRKRASAQSACCSHVRAREGIVVWRSERGMREPGGPLRKGLPVEYRLASGRVLKPPIVRLVGRCV